MGLPFARLICRNKSRILSAPKPNPKTTSRVEDVPLHHAGFKLILHHGIPSAFYHIRRGAVALA